ncbi:MAG: hypothetical protein BWY74_00507 [Firmicutes bacterium ADurb.Bin419]|nr:MAG: hypothetical protein BWY74_00507 [Firmicutes bacterium ADurb.Bin419]
MSMNVGDIYATLGIDTSEFKKGTEEAVTSIRKFGKFVDDVMAKTSGSVKGAGVSFKDVQNTVTELAQAVKRAKPLMTAPESEWKTYDTLHGYLEQIKKTFKELGDDGGSAFRKVRNEVDSALAGASQAGNGLTAMRNELRQLGKEDYSAETAKKMADLRLQITKTNNELRNASKDGFAKTMNAGRSLFSVLQVGIGALGMFGFESEKLQKTMVQSMGMLQGLTTIQQLYSQGVFASTVNLIKETGAKIANTLATAGATKAQMAWNTALMANPIGLVLAGVAALGAAIYGLVSAFKHFNKDAAHAAKTQKMFNEEISKGVAETAGEQIEVNRLFSAYKDFNKSAEERKEILKEINEKYGQYLPQLLDEHSSLEEIDTAYKKINASIQDVMKAKIRQGMQDKIMSEEMMKDLQKYNEKIFQSQQSIERNQKDLDAILSKSDRSLGEKHALSTLPKIISDGKKELEKFEKKRQDIINQMTTDMELADKMMEDLFANTSTGVNELVSGIEQYEGSLENLMQKADSLSEVDRKRFDELKSLYIDDAKAAYENVKAKMDAENVFSQFSMKNMQRKAKAEMEYRKAIQKFEREVAGMFKTPENKDNERNKNIELTEIQKLNQALDDLNAKTTERLLLGESVAEVSMRQVQAELELWARYIANNEATEDQIAHFNNLLTTREKLKVQQEDKIEDDKEEVTNLEKLNASIARLNQQSIIKLNLGENLSTVTQEMVKAEMDLLYAYILTGEATELQIERYKQLKEAYNNIQQNNQDLTDSFAEMGDQISSTINSAVKDMATASIEMLASGESINSVGLMIMGTFADMAIQIGKIAVGTGAAIKGIKQALLSLNPYVVAAAGAALIALGGFVKGQLKKVANPQGLATGGIVTQGGVFEVGEKGRERVMLPRGSAVIPNHFLEGNVNNGFIASTKINGRDLEIILERTSVQTKRR